MSARKLEKLEKMLYRTVRDIKQAETPSIMLDYIKRYGKLDAQYFKLTGNRFTPIHDHETLQDVEWGYRQADRAT